MRHFAWDDLQFFLAVARSGQLSTAGRQLHANHATVSRRIDRLESALGVKLFERNPRGYTLTAAGDRLLETAESIEREATSLRMEAAKGAAPLSGVVRLSTLEGFGHFFLADRLPGLARAYPALSIEFVTIQQIVALSRREADMSVTLTAPRAGSYHHEKITMYRLFVYGARDYLAAHEPVEHPEQFAAHRFIGYIEDMVFTPGLDYLRQILPELRASYQSSSIHAQLSATLKGLGLCVLPYYIASRYPELEPVLPKKVHLERDYWRICHQDLTATPRIRMLTDFIKAQADENAGAFHGEALLA